MVAYSSLRNSTSYTDLPQYENLNKADLSEWHRCSFELDKFTRYNKDTKFRSLINGSLQRVYEKKIIEKSPRSDQEKQAWLLLKDFVKKQLVDQDLENKIKTYKLDLRNVLYTNQPKSVLLQIASIHQLSDKTWKQILNSQEIPDDLQKAYTILSGTYDFIYEQIVLPSRWASRKKSNALQKLNISNPSEWFPNARKMHRRIVMHVGPTNSGKTYKALERLKQIDRGYYAGPLRLLAREVYEKFQKEGHPCNLLTGEEVINTLDDKGLPAGLTSGTVEMVPLSKKFDVVVLDEIQMMNDTERGWAWTNALLGVQAREIHLCGEPSVLPVIESIIKLTGDKLVINHYERLGSLEVEEAPLKKGLAGLKPGDCVVAFSKKKILDLKLSIERQTKYKVAVIYGSLPPETRMRQAQMFNSGEYDLMVASDAIGMGLNLSIKRIVFTTSVKFNGEELIELSNSNIKQIGGRAGRYKGNNDDQVAQGYITALDKKVLNKVRRAMRSPVQYISTAVTWPTDEICEQLMIESPPFTSPSKLLEDMAQDVEMSSNKLFTLSGLKRRIEAMQLFECSEDIPFAEKLRLGNAPVKNLPLVTNAFKEFCDTIAKRETRSLLSYRLPFHILDYKYIENEKYGLEIYESLYNIIILFFWLSNRYPNYFVDLESAQCMKQFCELVIFAKLDKLRKNPYNSSKRGVSNKRYMR